MNDITIYRPHKKVFAWTLPFVVVFGVLSFAAAGYFVSYWEYDVLLLVVFLVVLGIFYIWFAKFSYDNFKLTLLFEPHGLRVISNGYEDYGYAPWEDLLYAYYARNSKGHEFVVLSPNALSRKEAKRLVCRGGNFYRVCIDGAFVIPLDSFQDVSKVTEIIESRVPHIVSY